VSYSTDVRYAAESEDRGAGAPRVNLLGVLITPTNLADTVKTLETWRAEGKREYVCCVSVHGIVEAQSDPAFRSVLSRAALTTQDGMPLVWWCQHAGFKAASRACGRDVMLAMCEIAAEKGHRHYFYGGAPGIPELLVANLTKRFPGLPIAGYRSPPFRQLSPGEDAREVAMINETKPDFVWIGLGTPKQDRWMADHLGKIEAAAMLGVGAAFDFHAGVKSNAPQWMQRSGLEWLFRLASEPRRLAGRYLIGNSIFVARATQQLLGWKSYGGGR